MYINPKFLNIFDKDIDELKVNDIKNSNFNYLDDLKNIFYNSNKKKSKFNKLDKYGKLSFIPIEKINHHDDKSELTSLSPCLHDNKKGKFQYNNKLNLNFLNYTIDVQKNIQLLIETCCKLLNAEIILYIYKNIQDDKEQYHIISSNNEKFVYNSDDFKEKVFYNEIFDINHYYLHLFFNIHESKYRKTDPFIRDYKIKGGYGILINSQYGINSSLCVLYKSNPEISYKTQLILQLVSKAIELLFQIYLTLKN
ncbi:MAG: hypothetical protein ACTSRI_07235 [Promethearchaeota archaeon]